MLAVVPESFEKAWCGPDDDDLRTMLRDLERVHLPNSPQNAFNRVNLIERIQNCLDALKLDHLRVFKEIEKADPQGIETASDLLSHRLHLRPEAAYAQVRTATQLEEFPTLDRFVHEGALTQEATSIMLRTLRRFRKHLSPEDMAEAEGEMLVAAREMDPRQLKDHGSDLLHRYNRKAHNDELREEREKRFFDLRRRWDGWFSCEGYLDPEGSKS